MNQSESKTQEKFILALLSFFAIATLVWLFQSFLLVLVFAALFAISTYGIFHFFERFCSETLASLLMCTLCMLLVILPAVYLISVSVVALSSELPQIINQIRTLQMDSLLLQLQSYLNSLPFLSDFAFENYLLTDYEAEIKMGLLKLTEYLLNFSRMLIGSFNILISLGLFIFILFFLYKDGHNIALRVKCLLPTSRLMSERIAQMFESLCVVYMLNTILIAIIQGLGFGLLVSFFDLPAYYLGLIFLLASFIPVIGTLIVWVPVVIYLFLLGNMNAAIIIITYTVLVSGILIDYGLRAQLIEKLSALYPDQTIKPTSLVVILSTLAGVIEFGVLGLILGPLVASTALGLIQIHLENKTEIT